MGFVFDENEIRKTIAIMHPDGQYFEIRFVDGRWNMAGMFSDADTLIQQLKTIGNRVRPGANVYMTLNELHEACYDRKHHNCFIELQSPTVSDNDVTWYQWLLIDVDPVRPSGTSSTNEQLKASRETAKKIYQWLKDRGWPDPIIAHSGNGTHLQYKIQRMNTPENKKLIENVLKTIGMLFADSEMSIDLTTFNPSRVCKLYGTVARKGANTEKRPHRMSKILRVPDKIEAVPADYLEALVQMLPQEEKPQRYNSYNPGSFDLEKWISDHGLDVRERTSWSGGTKWILNHCPFNPEHDKKDAAIIQTTGGKIGFRCFHNSCADKGWRELRLLYEPDAYQNDDKKAVPNYMQDFKGFKGDATAEPPAFSDQAGDDHTPSDPVFRTTEEIRQRVVPDEEHILTGIKGIDDRMIGLKKTFVTALSGLRAAGKSSILSQLVIQCRQQGLRCALFSGEMTDKQVLKWLTLQAAGKAHVHPTKYDKVFYPNDDAALAISKWLDGYVYVYNNDYGNDYTKLRTQLYKIVTEKQLDIIFLDNLMALNVEALDRDMYVRQTKFVTDLKRMAKALNIHILFVAHPRKSGGYLRMDDISGSGDLANAADNVFIVHRVDDDYRKLTGQFFGWKNTNPIYNASNVIEICKDRDLGNRDVHVPLYFEKETKRLKNAVAEYVHYGWEKTFMTEVFPEDSELPF